MEYTEKFRKALELGGELREMEEEAELEDLAEQAMEELDAAEQAAGAREFRDESGD